MIGGIMTVTELLDKLPLRALCLPDPDRDVTGGYTGDLLSWVMGSAQPGQAWVTIMSNVNVVAVATLCDVSCVILAQGVTLEPEVLKTAESKLVNVLTSPLPAFELCLTVGELIR